MSAYLEAILTLLPSDAGGRSAAISPRDGSYRPYAITERGEILRIRVIEGPPAVAPGQNGRVVAEVESELITPMDAGSELAILDRDDRYVGILTVTRALAVDLSSRA